MKIGNYEVQVPFVTTAADSIAAVVQLADVKEGQRVIDLGSGDGRVVLAFAKAGAFIDGFEVKPALVARANQRITEAGLQDRAHIYQEDFWQVNLGQYDIVYIYGMGSIMGRLEKKLQTEARPGTRVLLNVFTLPHLKIKKTKDNVHLYIL